ncbi:MAG: glycosyltransferase [Gemmatimonadaceae bacterium]|nr:glycosyltransferase [Gloeobacterales cyanobacterium ES-bin-141]
MTNLHQISIVVPVYNGAGFLGEALESVLEQSHTNWEVWIVDDGSADNTLAVARSYCRRDPRIRLLSQANAGPSAARNLGIQAATGKFIAFLDADDFWLPDKLAMSIRHLIANPRLGVSYGRVAFMDERGVPTGDTTRARLRGLKPVHLLYSNPTTTPSNLVIRREVIEAAGDFDLQLRYCEDLDWVFRVLCTHHWQVEGIDLVLIRYRTNTTGASADLHRMQAGWEAFIAKARTTAPELVEAHCSLARAAHLQYLARRALRLGLPPAVSSKLIHDALAADWRLVVQQPRRSLLTLAAVYSRHLINRYPA